MDLKGIKSLIPKRPVEDSESTYTMSPAISVDWKEIDTGSIDLSIPVIVVTAEDGSYLPIDGWHRMAKALDLNIMSLPVVLLDKEESEEVSIS